jgi:hypothetical protein
VNFLNNIIIIQFQTLPDNAFQIILANIFITFGFLICYFLNKIRPKFVFAKLTALLGFFTIASSLVIINNLYTIHIGY